MRGRSVAGNGKRIAIDIRIVTQYAGGGYVKSGIFIGRVAVVVSHRVGITGNNDSKITPAGGNLVFNLSAVCPAGSACRNVNFNVNNFGR